MKCCSLRSYPEYRRKPKEYKGKNWPWNCLFDAKPKFNDESRTIGAVPSLLSRIIKYKNIMSHSKKFVRHTINVDRIIQATGSQIFNLIKVASKLYLCSFTHFSASPTASESATTEIESRSRYSNRAPQNQLIALLQNKEPNSQTIRKR